MDWNHIYTLLIVVEKATAHPNLTALRNAALDELMKLQDGEEHTDGEA